jgi:[acyl-carrier-protein] S-malonyltransferase
MKRALVFPGQGSQAVGMGLELSHAFRQAKDVFAEVDEALGQHLSRLMTEGPEADLNLTENAQPAIMAVSLAVMRVLGPASNMAALVAGHSLGEYSALTAAGSFTLADAARLLKLRGQAMQRAVPVGVGAMAALIGLDYEPVAAIAAEAAQGQVCAAANDNAPGQVVVSGHRQAVERAIALAAEQGARKSVLLPVSAPFHCALMQPAADEMRTALEKVAIMKPSVPLIANVTAAEVTDPDEIRDLLVQQVTGTVRWRESVIAMRDAGITELVEIGHGKVLSGLARRIDREMAATSIGTPQEIEAFMETV